MKLPKLADKYLCTGCLACVDVCPSSAITDMTDTFMYMLT